MGLQCQINAYKKTKISPILIPSNNQALTDAQIYHLHFSRHSLHVQFFQQTNGLSRSHLLSLAPTLGPSFQLLSYSYETTHEPDHTTHPSSKGSYPKKIILTQISFLTVHAEPPKELHQLAGRVAQEENSQSWELRKLALTPKKHLHNWNISTTKLKTKEVVITHLHGVRFKTYFLSILIIQTVDEKGNWVRKPVYLIQRC